ncbi:MAG: glycosyltransferase [Acidimicrobiales bacterium]
MSEAMSILVCPETMELAGSQLNAIELAKGVQDRGHRVVLFGRDGDLVPLARDLGLEFILAPPSAGVRLWANATELIEVVRSRNIGLVHGYERGPSLELAFGPHLRWSTPLVITVQAMSVASELPRHVPLIVGTEELAQRQRRKGYQHVELLEPPIDLNANRPGIAGGCAARAGFGFGAQDIVVVIVGRLTDELDKLAGVEAAMAGVGRLTRRAAVRLLVVGGGQGEARVRALAAEVNRHAGRPVVTVAGQLLDPRAAYDCADIVVGMGGSALKGLAFGKPVVVVGASGFVRLVEETSAATFLFNGWYGHGEGSGYVDELERVLHALIEDAHLRVRLGNYGLGVLVPRFALTGAIERQIDMYRAAIRAPAGGVARLRGLARSAQAVARGRVRRAPNPQQDLSD